MTVNDHQEPVKPERGSPEWIAAWKCCGCGMVHGEDLAAACDCPTACIGRGGRGYKEIAVKVYPPAQDLVDRVALAIASEDGGPGNPLGYFPQSGAMRDAMWEDFMPEQHEAWRRMARAAIAAMPESAR